jgi:uncharacterized protein involved in exopolysaccharide biosynthesis
VVWAESKFLLLSRRFLASLFVRTVPVLALTNFFDRFLLFQSIFMNNRDSLVGVLGVLYRWRKAIFIVCLLALLGSVIVALMLPNYYKSTTSFYAANPKLVNPELIFGYSSAETDLFGGDRDLERLIEIANGATLVDYMVQKFDLFKHYDIDSTSKEGRFYVRETFRGHYSALKNKNDAMEVTIEDTDPEMAAQMANAVREYVNITAQKLAKQSQAKMLAAFDMNTKRKLSELNLLADSMRHIQLQYNIFNPGTQSERLSYLLNNAESEITRGKARLEVLQNNPVIPRDTIEYIKANLRAFEREREKLLSNREQGGMLSAKGYTEGSPAINILSDLHFQARKQLSFDMERYNQLLAAYNSDIPLVHTITVAEVPMMKSRPQRTIIVAASVIAALLFAFLGALIMEAYRNVDWKELSENA